MEGYSPSQVGPPAWRFDSPDGQIAHGSYAQIARRVNLSQPDGVAVTPKSAADSPRPALTKRGVSRSSRNVGCGMRWTLWRRKTSGAQADGKIVWSWRPDAGVKLAEAIPPTTVAKEPGHRGEHEYKLLKPLRRDGRVNPANLW